MHGSPTQGGSNGGGRSADGGSASSPEISLRPCFCAAVRSPPLHSQLSVAHSAGHFPGPWSMKSRHILTTCFAQQNALRDSHDSAINVHSTMGLRMSGRVGRSNLKGKRFGRLTALKFVGSTKNRESLWLCACDCGNKRIVRKHGVKGGVKVGQSIAVRLL